MGGVCGKEDHPTVDNDAPVPPKKVESPTSPTGDPHQHSQQQTRASFLSNKPAPGAAPPAKHHRTLTDLYKHCKYPNADQLKALGTYPVADIFDHFIRGEVLGKGGYGEVVVVQKKPLDQMDDQIEIKEIENCEEKFAMKSITQIRKGKHSLIFSLVIFVIREEYIPSF
jgi:hypothetical protein